MGAGANGSVYGNEAKAVIEHNIDNGKTSANLNLTKTGIPNELRIPLTKNLTFITNPQADKDFITDLFDQVRSVISSYYYEWSHPPKGPSQ